MSQTMIIMFGALLAELLLVLVALLTVSFLRNRAARQRDRRAMAALVAQVKQDKPGREQAIERFLAQGLGITGDALDAAKTAILRAEMVLLQRFAAIYRGRDAKAAARFHTDVASALEPYHALSGSPGDEAPEEHEAQPPDNAELEMLRKDNQRLENELRITMETMSRMLNEYSTMFADDGADEPPMVSADEVGVPLDDAVAAPVPAGDDDGVAAEPAFDEPTADMAAEAVTDEVRDADAVAAETTADADDDFEISVGIDEEDPPAKAPGDAGDSDEKAASVAAAPDPEDTDAVVDPVEEILRQAATQEQMARGADAGAEEVPVADPDDGAIEVMLDDEPTVAATQPPEDELFDAAPAAESAAGAGKIDEAQSAEALFDAGDEPLRSRSGG